MNSENTVREGNVNWVNMAQNRVNWHRFVDLLFHLRCPHTVLLGRWANFSCSEITFTYTDAVHLVNIQMGDTHNDMRPANLTSAAYEKCSFVMKVGSKHDRIKYKVTFTRTTPLCCDRWLCCGWAVAEVSRILALFLFSSGYCSQVGN
jgi:hypothetical protein